MGAGFDIQTEKEKLLAEILGLMCALSTYGLDYQAQDDIDMVKEDIFEEIEIMSLKGE